MMRGEIWIAQADLYATKVRPILIVQADEYDTYDSTIACLLTTHKNSNDAARVKIEPDTANGLKEISFVMTDKIFSFDRTDLAKKVGYLSSNDMQRTSEKLKAILGI